MTIFTIIDWLSKIGSWISSHTYIVTFAVVAVLIFVFYFIGKAKLNKQKAISNGDKVDAPKTEKNFVQGEEVKRQEFETTKEDKHE